MLGDICNEISAAIANDRYGTIGQNIRKAPKPIVATHLYLRTSVGPLLRCDFAIYMNSVVKTLCSFEQSIAAKSDLSTASREKFCHLVVDQLGSEGALSLLDNATFKKYMKSQTAFPHNSINYIYLQIDIDNFHDAITIAVALDLPGAMKACSGGWRKHGYHEGLLPSPIALSSTSESVPSMLDELLEYPATAAFLISAEWPDIHRAWEYAVKHGKMSAANKIAGNLDWVEHVLEEDAQLRSTMYSLIEGDYSQELNKLLTVLQTTEQCTYVNLKRTAKGLLRKGSKLSRPNIVELAPSYHLKTHDFSTAKMKAASGGYGNIISQLMQKDELGDLDLFLDGPLVEAASRGFVGATDVIMDWGGDSKIGRQPRDESFHDALEKAALNGHTDCVDVLLRHRRPNKKWVSTLMKRASSRGYPCVSRLLQTRIFDEKERSKILA